MPDLTVGQIKSKRMLYLALSTLTLLFLGLIYAFSMFAGPICTTFGLEKAAVGLTFNIMMITFCVGAVIGSQIEAKIGVRNTLFVAAALFFCGFAGTGLFGNGSITVVYLCYGTLGGLGVGMGYNTIVSTTNLWFPDKVGFSSGVLMMGFGLGSLILGTLSVNLVPTFGLSSVFAAIGVVTCVVVVALALLLRRPPADIVSRMAPEKATGTGFDPGEQDAALNASAEAAAYIMKDLEWDDDSITDEYYAAKGGSHTITVEDGQWVEAYAVTLTPVEASS